MYKPKIFDDKTKNSGSAGIFGRPGPKPKGPMKAFGLPNIS